MSKRSRFAPSAADRSHAARPAWSARSRIAATIAVVALLSACVSGRSRERRDPAELFASADTNGGRRRNARRVPRRPRGRLQQVRPQRRRVHRRGRRAATHAQAGWRAPRWLDRPLRHQRTTSASAAPSSWTDPRCCSTAPTRTIDGQLSKAELAALKSLSNR